MRDPPGMNRYLCLALIVGCSSRGVVADSGPDADSGDMADASDSAMVDASDSSVVDSAADVAEASVCVCVGVTPCCDGCLARNLGIQCDDGLACTTGSTCGAAGACGTGSAVSCAPPSEPECQSAMCAEPGGCATTNIREGMVCSDDNTQTYDDHCASGACVGTACECSTGTCCDGCHFRTPSFKCLDDGPIEGTCTGAFDQVTPTCGGTPSVSLRIGDRFCSATSSVCNGSAVPDPGDVYMNGTCYALLPDGSPHDANNPLRCMASGSSTIGVTCGRCL